MDFSDLVNIATQISTAGALYETAASVQQSSEELNKHCLDLIREKHSSQESLITTVQFLGNRGIRSDKLRETTSASIKVINSAKHVPCKPFGQSMSPADVSLSSGVRNVRMATELGDLSSFIRTCHEDFLNDALCERTRAAECVSLNECTKNVADEWNQLSEDSASGHLFPADKVTKTGLRDIVRFYYDLVSRVKQPQASSTSSVSASSTPVDFLQYVPSEMPSTHPNAKAASGLWKTLKAVLPPPSSSSSSQSKWSLTAFANAGMTFLQAKFSNIIKNTVDSNLTRARVSITAGFDTKVEGFLKIIGRGFNTWGKMYYLILSGEHKLALSLITNKEGVVERALSDFCSNKPISEGLYDKLSRIRENPRNDRYLNIILSVLLRDIRGIPQLGSVDELLWVALAIVRGSGITESDGLAYDAISHVYKQLERSRKSFSESPYVYASALVLLGKFREAAEYLRDSKDECVQIDAAHLALAIALRVHTKAATFDESSNYTPSSNSNSDSDDEDGTYDDDEDRNYIFSDKCNGKNLATALTSIVEAYPARVGLTNKGASPYLGLVVTLPGGTVLIRQFLDESSLPTSSASSSSRSSTTSPSASANNLSKMLKNAGKDSERFCAVAEALAKEGSIKKAMYLFNSIGEYGRAAHLLYVLLGAVVQLPANDPERRELLKFAAALERHRERDLTLRVLRAMAEFFDYYSDGKWADAVLRPDFCGLIPSTDNSMEAVERCAQQFMNPYKTPKEVSQNVPSVLVGMMECIQHCVVLKSDRNLVCQLRGRVSGIITFVALVSDRLPPETSATILRIKEQIERN